MIQMVLVYRDVRMHAPTSSTISPQNTPHSETIDSVEGFLGFWLVQPILRLYDLQIELGKEFPLNNNNYFFAQPQPALCRPCYRTPFDYNYHILPLQPPLPTTITTITNTTTSNHC